MSQGRVWLVGGFVEENKSLGPSGIFFNLSPFLHFPSKHQGRPATGPWQSWKKVATRFCFVLWGGGTFILLGRQMLGTDSLSLVFGAHPCPTDIVTLTLLMLGVGTRASSLLQHIYWYPRSSRLRRSLLRGEPPAAVKMPLTVGLRNGRSTVSYDSISGGSLHRGSHLSHWLVQKLIQSSRDGAPTIFSAAFSS